MAQEKGKQPPAKQAQVATNRLIQKKKTELLLDAAEAGDLDEVQRLSEREGVDVNCRDFKRFATPLMRAASQSRLKIIQYLMSRGARTDLVDNVGWDALHWACWGAGAAGGWVTGQTYMVINILVSDGGSKMVKRQTHTGFTSLMFLVKYLGQKGVKNPTKKDDPKAKGRKQSLVDQQEMDTAIPASVEQMNAIKLLLLAVQDVSGDSSAPKDPVQTKKLVELKNRFGQTVFDMTNRKDVKRVIRDLLATVPGGAKLTLDESESTNQSETDKQKGDTKTGTDENEDETEEEPLVKPKPEGNQTMFYCFSRGDKAKSKDPIQSSPYFKQKEDRGFGNLFG